MTDKTTKLDSYLATRGLRGKRIIEPDLDDLIDILAMDIMGIARNRAGLAGAFHLALSGGSTPRVLYQRLMIDPRFRGFPWQQTHLWIVDDRCVPFEDEKSNWKMIREMIVDHVPIPPAQVHPMMVLDPAGDVQYETALRAALGAQRVENRLDFILLGMGPDAHTASLFPCTPALNESQRWVVFNDGDTVVAPRPRLTMTYPIINSARNIAILATGESKFPTLQTITAAPDDVQQFPINGVRPSHEDTQLTWYLDGPAAGDKKPGN